VFKFMNPDEKGESIAAKLVRKKQGWIFFVIGWDWDSVCQVGCVDRDLKTYIKVRVKRFVCWFNLFGFLLKEFDQHEMYSWVRSFVTAVSVTAIKWQNY
jgi:hypothetical protein